MFPHLFFGSGNGVVIFQEMVKQTLYKGAYLGVEEYGNAFEGGRRGFGQCSSLKCAHAFQCEGLQNNHTSFKLSNLFCNTSPQNLLLDVLYWKNKNTIKLISHYIEEVHAINWCTIIIWISHIMHLIIIQLQRQSPPSFCRFLSVNFFSLIHIFHRKST